MPEINPLDSFIESRKQELEAKARAELDERLREQAIREAERRRRIEEQEARLRFEPGISLDAVFSPEDVRHCQDFLNRVLEAGLPKSYFYIVFLGGFFRTNMDNVLKDTIYNEFFKQEQSRALEQSGNALYGYPIGCRKDADHYSYKEYDRGSPSLEEEVVVLCGDGRLRNGYGKNPEIPFQTGSYQEAAKGTEVSRWLGMYATEHINKHPYTVYKFVPGSVPESLARTLVDLSIV